MINKITHDNSMSFISTCLLFISSFALASPTANNKIKFQHLDYDKVQHNTVPNGLEKSEWQDIKQQISLSKYHAKENSKGNFSSSNIANGWSIEFNKNGQTQLTSPNNKENDKIALKLESFKRKEQIKFTQPKKIQTDKDKLTYHWNDNVQEVWINSPQQLEQWFIIEQKPLLNSSKSLVVNMALNTNLAVNLHGNSLNFGNKINYNKLKVWDSNNKAIPATMQLHDQQLSLVIDDSQAHYPLTIDPSFQQQSYIKPINADIEDRFGFSVAISTDTLVVGAPLEASGSGNLFDNGAPAAGAAYVFVRGNQDQWNFQDYLKASIIDASDVFGFSVAISGDLIVIGAPGEGSDSTGVNGDASNNSALGSGAAYIFSRTGSSWSQVAYLKASNSDAQDKFGTSVAISETTVVIGAPDESSNTTGVDGNEANNDFGNSGAAYIFENSLGTWNQAVYLKASNTEMNDRFGSAVAIHNQFLVIGAPNEDSNGNEIDNSAPESGAAYVYLKSGITGDWIFHDYIKAPITDSGDLFGTSVAIDIFFEWKIVIGAPGEDSNDTGVINGPGSGNNLAPSSGAVYVFALSFASGWFQRTFIKASNTQSNDQFGISVSLSTESISDRRIIVGAHKEDSIATGVDGDENTDSVTGNSGAAYVFLLNISDVWSQVSYVKASNSGDGDNFGTAVAISGKSIAVGAALEDGDGSPSDNDNVSNAGAAYVFKATKPLWEQDRMTKSFNIDEDDQFGFAIAMTDDTLVVGAYLEDGGSIGVNGDENDDSSADSGAVYIFVKDLNGNWQHQAYLKASNTGADDQFGYSVAISGDTVVIGAINEDSIATGVQGDQSSNSADDSGAVYVFTRNNKNWTQQAYIKASNTESLNTGDLFGTSVAISGNTLVVGAEREDSDSVGINGDQTNNDAAQSGAAYVFVRDGSNNWSQQSYVKAFNTGNVDRFGHVVTIAGDTMVISAFLEDGGSTVINGNDNDNTLSSGAVYAFSRSNGIWSQDAYIKAFNADSGDQFGGSIALSQSGATLVVGAINEDSNSVFSPNDNSLNASGAVYVFKNFGSGWINFGYIKPNTVNTFNWFGYSVAITDVEFLADSAILVGARLENSKGKNINTDENDNSLSQSGAAYLFIGDAVGNWQQQTYFKASNSGANDNFGHAIAATKHYMVIGAPREDTSFGSVNNDLSNNSGAIYIFDSGNFLFRDGFE